MLGGGVRFGEKEDRERWGGEHTVLYQVCREGIMVR